MDAQYTGDGNVELTISASEWYALAEEDSEVAGLILEGLSS